MTPEEIGGLGSALATGRILAHPDAFQPKFSHCGHYIGTPVGLLERASSLGWDILWTNGPTEIIPGVFVTGPIPRHNHFEDNGGPFFLDPAGQQPDPLSDDQAIYFYSPRGWVVLLGCAHAGVINTLEYICQLIGQTRLHAVGGGMHLGQASQVRLSSTITALRRYDLDLLAPCHCTGLPTTVQLWSAFPDVCRECAVGVSFDF